MIIRLPTVWIKLQKYSVGHSPITFILIWMQFVYLWVFLFIMQEIFLQKKFKKPWCSPTPEYHSRQLFLSLQRKHLPAQWIIVIVQEETTTINNITGRDALISSLCCFLSFSSTLRPEKENRFFLFLRLCFQWCNIPSHGKDSVPASFWVLAQRTIDGWFGAL